MPGLVLQSCYLDMLGKRQEATGLLVFNLVLSLESLVTVKVFSRNINLVYMLKGAL